MRKVVVLAATAVLGGSLVGCTAEDSSSDVPASGTSSNGAPASIIGCTLDELVNSSSATGSATASPPGSHIIYTFQDANTILGDGLNTLPTSSWSYTLSGNVATVQLNYGDIGESTETLTFTSETGGTFASAALLYGSGSTASLEGTFTITGSCSAAANDGTTNTGTTDADGNGTIATAEVAPSPAFIADGFVNDTTDEEDFFSFTGTGANFTATLSNYGSNDLDLYLLDSGGSTVSQSASASNTTETVAPGSLVNGATYYLRVRAFSTGGADSSYHLDVTQ